MKMFQLLAIACLGCASSCTSKFASKDPVETESRLLRVVPVGASEGTLLRTAASQHWRILGEPYQSDGSPTSLNDAGYKCYSEPGGKVVPMIIAEYWRPFKTTLEAQWILNSDHIVTRVCVRTTTDAT